MAENQRAQSHRHATIDVVTDLILKPKPDSANEHLRWQDDLGSGVSNNLEEIEPSRFHRNSSTVTVSLET